MINQTIIQGYLYGMRFDEKLINLSGRQRMLSQKVNLAFYQYQHSDISQMTLREIFKEWRDNHTALQALVSELSFELKQDPHNSLKLAYDHIRYVENSIMTMAKPLTQSQLRDLNNNQNGYLSIMEDYVALLESQGNNHLSRIIIIELSLAFLSLIILFAEFKYIIRPIHRDLRKAVERKDKLFQEFNHRMKNNLQLLISLFRMNKIDSNDQCAGIIDQAVSRIESVNQIHLHLMNDSEDKVDLKSYMIALNEKLSSLTAANFQLSYVGGEIDVSSQQAQNIGMIINELITNSIKYASLNIGDLLCPSIEFKISNKSIRLKYSDNGKVDLSQPSENSGIGKKLIEAFVNQINGTMKLDNIQGITYSFSFPRFAYL
jgi:two-component sensor histidine kinase